MTKTGKATINYSPRVKFPSYMLAANYQHDSDQKDRKLSKKHSLLVEDYDFDNLFGAMTVVNISSVGVYGFNSNSEESNELSKKLSETIFQQVENQDNKVKEFVTCSEQDEVWDPT